MKSHLIALGAVAALSVPVLAQTQHQGMDHSRMGHANTPYMPAEMRMSERMMAASGSDASEQWTRKMIEHHRGAIEMSRIALQNTRDPETRRMANETIAAQTREIAKLNAMLAKKGKRPQ